MTVRGLRGPIEWPGDEIPDVRRRPLLAAVAGLHAMTRVVIHALYPAHPGLEGRSEDDARRFVAQNVVTSAEQLLGSLDLYIHCEQLPGRRPASPPPQPRAEPAPQPPRWQQMSLPFPGRETTAALARHRS